MVFILVTSRPSWLDSEVPSALSKLPALNVASSPPATLAHSWGHVTPARSNLQDWLSPWFPASLPPRFQIRELVPESQAYMDLLAFERKLDQTIMRKRVDIQEALKRPMKVP